MTFPSERPPAPEAPSGTTCDQSGLISLAGLDLQTAEVLPFPVAILGPGWIFEYLNPAFERTFGYTLGDLPDRQAWFEQAYPDQDYRDQVQSQVEGWELAGEVSPDQTLRRVRTKDGRQRLVRYRVATLGQDRVIFIFEDVTEQRQAQMALAESERKFRLLADNSGDVIVITDADLKLTYVSPAVQAVYGYTPEEFLALSAEDLFTSASKATLGEVRRQRLERESIRPGGTGQMTVAVEHLHRDGRAFWVEINSNPIRDESGRITGYVGVIRDITERILTQQDLKRTKDELEERVRGRTSDLEAANLTLQAEVAERRRSEAALQLLVESSAAKVSQDFFDTAVTNLARWLGCELVWIGEFQPDGQVHAWSMIRDGRLVRDHRYPLVGSPCAEAARHGFCHVPRGVVERFPQDRALAESGAEGYVGLAIRDASGRVDGVLAAVSRGPLELPERTRSVLTILADRAAAEIQRFRAALAIKASDRLKQTVLNSLTAQICVLDAAGRIIAVNRAWEGFARESPDSPLSQARLGDDFLQPWRETAAVDLTEAPAIVQGVGGVLVGQADSFSRDYALPGGAGPRWFSLIATPLGGQGGGVVISHQEITTQKQAERALLLAKESAEQANRTKNQFIANMSHEFRTPLNHILGLGELLADLTQGEEAREYLIDILASGQKLLGLINDLIQLSKLEAGLIKSVADEFDPTALIRHAVQRRRAEAQARGLSLTWRTAPDLPRLLCGDPTHLGVIIDRLVANALKFTTQGGVGVAAEMAQNQGPGSWLHLTVADTGPGIPESVQGGLFVDLTQADGSASRRFGGLGLGLTLTRRLVELLGGRMWVESQVDHGSVFHLLLPVTQEHDPA